MDGILPDCKTAANLEQPSGGDYRRVECRKCGKYLSALQTGGHISAHEKTTLEAVADAGNASAHRGYTPTVERLGHIVDIIENFLHRAFVLAGAAEDIRKTTPARQK